MGVERVMTHTSRRGIHYDAGVNKGSYLRPIIIQMNQRGADKSVNSFSSIFLTDLFLSLHLKFVIIGIITSLKGRYSLGHPIRC